jgi:hypothetical protein
MCDPVDPSQVRKGQIPLKSLAMFRADLAGYLGIDFGFEEGLHGEAGSIAYFFTGLQRWGAAFDDGAHYVLCRRVTLTNCRCAGR